MSIDGNAKDGNDATAGEKDDPSICDRIRCGNPEAIAELTMKYKTEILRTLRIQIRKSARSSATRGSNGDPTTSKVNSLLNESLVKLINYIRAHKLERTDEMLLPTLFKISKNLLIDRYRRNMILNVVPMDNAIDQLRPMESSGNLTEQEESLMEIEKLVETFPQAERELFHDLLNGKSYDEMGQERKKSPGAVRAESSRLKRKIKREISE